MGKKKRNGQATLQSDSKPPFEKEAVPDEPTVELQLYEDSKTSPPPLRLLDTYLSGG